MNKSSVFTERGEKGHLGRGLEATEQVSGTEGATKVLTAHVCSLSSRWSGQGGAAPASGVDHPGGLGGTMVHGLRGHQAALLPVHCPQVRSSASWPLHPLTFEPRTRPRARRHYILPSSHLSPKPAQMLEGE